MKTTFKNTSGFYETKCAKQFLQVALQKAKYRKTLKENVT